MNERDQTTLSEEDRHIILHSLGLSRPRRWSYRNHYCADDDDPTLARMVGRGLMRRGPRKRQELGGMTLFHVTATGALAAGVLHKVRKEDRGGLGDCR